MSDRVYLVELYNNTKGYKWFNNLNWATDVRYGLWFGIKVDSGGHANTINLNDNNLVGEIPDTDDLRLLVNLKYFYLSSNSICGQIPQHIDMLQSLVEINLSWNKLSGSIPDSLWKCLELKVLRLDNNNLDGILSSDVGELFRLKLLNLSHNNLSGVIPAVADRLPELQVIDFMGNLFEGPVPLTVRDWLAVSEDAQDVQDSI